MLQRLVGQLLALGHRDRSRQRRPGFVASPDLGLRDGERVERERIVAERADHRLGELERALAVAELRRGHGRELVREVVHELGRRVARLDALLEHRDLLCALAVRE